jgi:hypothetical protein
MNVISGLNAKAEREDILKLTTVNNSLQEICNYGVSAVNVATPKHQLSRSVCSNIKMYTHNVHDFSYLEDPQSY